MIILEKSRGFNYLVRGVKRNLKTILIIEDDPDAVEMLTVFFEKKGDKVVSAENGIDGLTMIKFLKPDVIILDLMIPGMDGKSLVSRMRENIYMKDKMIIVISGMFTQHYTGETIQDLDVQAVFSKPVNLKKLYASIEGFSQKPSAGKSTTKR
ncbi:MAG: response regulator [Fibrobacterota bacterium]